MLLVLLACATVLIGVHWSSAMVVVVLSFLVGRGPISAPTLLTLATVLTLVGPLYHGSDPSKVETWIGIATANGILILAPWLLGRYARDRRALVQARRRQAEQVEDRQRTLVHDARLRERTLIAREIHDTVGHELSLIALRAGALEVGVGTESTAASDAARQLREAASRATEQLGDVVSLLGDGEAAPLRPAHEDVAAVVDRATEAGLDATLTWEGDYEPLSPLVQRTVVRVVQEALTNATKHAPGSPVTVTITTVDNNVQIRVTDDGAATSPNVPPPEGGRGLIGLAERVRLLGGTFTAEATSQGFVLSAALPRDGQVGHIDDQLDLPEDQAGLDEVDLKHSRARRSLLVAILAPVAVLVVSTVATLGYFTFATVSSVLTPDEYADISVGQPRAEVEEFLPPVEMLEAPTDQLDPPARSDAECRYYESELSFFARRDVYRICFADDVVLSKDTIDDHLRR